MTGVYAIVNTATGRRYIGRSGNCETRWKEHRSALRGSRHYNAALQHDWQRYGEPGFTFGILEQLAIEDCQQREAWYLQQGEDLYNEVAWTSSGPRPGYKPPAWVGRKVSAALKGRPKTESHRAQLSAAMKGRKNPAHGDAIRGRKASEVTRAKMSEAHKQRYRDQARSPETCAKLSASLQGRIITWGNKISAAKRGIPQSPAQVAARMAGMKAARLRRAAAKG